MKRLIIGTAAAALLAGGAGVSFAGGGGPYPNGNNDFGLCTAWQAHEDHNPNGQPGPFAAMEAAYDEANGDGAWADHCAEILGNAAPGNSEHGHGH